MSDQPPRGDAFVAWKELTVAQQAEIRRRLTYLLSESDAYLWTFDTSADKWRAIPREGQAAGGRG